MGYKAQTRARVVILALPFLALAASAQERGRKTGRSASADFAQARASLDRGDLIQAQDQVRQGLKLDPRSVPGYNLLGIIETERKQYDNAAAAFKQALRLNPTSTKTHNNLANCYVQQHRLDLARAEYLAALRLDPRSQDANYNLGLVLLSGGHPGEAVTYLKRVSPADSSSQLALIRADLGDHKTAEGLELAQKVSGQNKSDARVQFSLGLVLIEARQDEAAEHVFELADALVPQNYEILYRLGEAAFRLKHYAKSEEALNQALKLKPDSLEILHLLAQEYADQRRDVDALQLLARARKLNPKDTGLIFLMARLSMLESFYEDAIPLLQEGIQLDPKRADLHAALGESYLASGKTDLAIEEFHTLVRLAPSAGSYAFLGLCYRSLGRFDEAAKCFQDGLKLDPRDGACLYNLGYIASRRGRPREAEAYLLHALKTNPNPNEADTLLELASLNVEEKKYQEALPLLQRAVKSASDPGPVFYKLARVERALGMAAAAERDLKIFETLSKGPAPAPYPFQHFFDVVNQRSALSPQGREKFDLEGLLDAARKHPDDPRNQYLLAEAYLRLGRRDDALKTIQSLDQLSGADLRTELGVGVLLARFRLYPEAVDHFQAALAADPNSDESRYDLADAYFNAHDYANALKTIQQVSPVTENDDSYLALLGDIESHLGRTDDAVTTLERAAAKNPDNDRYRLLLALAWLRKGSPEQASRVLRAGLSRSPSSGELYWGLGVASVVEGNDAQAEQSLVKATELLPDWQSTWSILGIFYFDTGQIAKARQTLERSKQLNPSGGVDASRIEQVLDRASSTPGPQSSSAPLSPETRTQFLEVALALADQAA